MITTTKFEDESTWFHNITKTLTLLHLERHCHSLDMNTTLETKCSLQRKMCGPWTLIYSACTYEFVYFDTRQSWVPKIF